MLELLPFLLVAAGAVLLWASSQDALVRGPLAVDRPMIDWPLSFPVDRRLLLRPLFYRAFLVRGSVGGVGGLLAVAAVGSTLMELPVDTPSWALFAPAVLSGALFGVLSAAVAVLIVHSPRGPVVLSWLTPVFVLFLVVLAGLGVASVNGAASRAAEWALLASGPWGWAAQGVLVSVGAAPTGWWVWLSALLCLTALVALIADRRLGTIPTAAFRIRSDMHAGVRSGLWITESNWLHGALREGSGGALASLRLPPPSRSWAVVLWRDALGLLRSPSALVWSWLFLSLAVVVTGADTGASTAVHAVAIVLSGTMVFFAVSRLLVGARFTASAPRRVLVLPHRPQTVVLLHGCIPLAVLVILAFPAVAFTVFAGATGALQTLLVLPIAVAGALAGTFRGALPLHLWIGYETPVGDTAPLQILSWQAQGLLVVVAASSPVLGGFVAGLGALGWSLVATLAVGWWAHGKGRKYGKGSS